jgi:hypothetical protein
MILKKNEINKQTDIPITSCSVAVSVQLRKLLKKLTITMPPLTA